MFAIVGLGNPGDEYANTRHNVGFMVVDELAKMLGAGGFKNEHSGNIAKARIDAQQLLLVKPTTYMNLSGNCLGSLGGYYKLVPEDFLIVCDDLDLPLGSVRLRQKGGSGGHNGLKSVQAALGTQEYNRIRIGIGRRTGEGQEDVIDHVLGRFSKQEAMTVQEAVLLAAKASIAIIRNGIVEAMNTYNPLGKVTVDDSPA